MIFAFSSVFFIFLIYNKRTFLDKGFNSMPVLQLYWLEQMSRDDHVNVDWLKLVAWPCRQTRQWQDGGGYSIFERTNVTWREQRRRLVENCTHLWLGLVAKPNGDNWLLYWLEQMSRDDHGRRWLVECCKHLWLGLAAKPNGDNGEDGGGAQLGPRRRLLTLLSLHLDIKLNIIDNY